MLSPPRGEVGTVSSGLSSSQGTGQGYTSGEIEKGAPLEASAVNDSADAIAASVLMDLRVDDGRSHAPQPVPRSQTQSQESTPKASQQCSISRGHKRTISKACDDLQSNVSDLLRREGPEVAIVEDVSGDAYVTKMAMADLKQIQKPNQPWARIKQPVSNGHLNKRAALDHCALQQRQVSAPEYASIFLRPDAQELVG